MARRRHWLAAYIVNAACRFAALSVSALWEEDTIKRYQCTDETASFLTQQEGRDERERKEE